MSRIIIYSPSYDPTSGGIIVLHKLCHILLDMGYNACLFPMNPGKFYVNNTYNVKIEKQLPLRDDDVVVYPEIVWGNPLNCKRVVRYIMNTGHITLNRKETWNSDDFWVYFSDRFYDGIKDHNILHIIDSKIQYYQDYQMERSFESCHTFRKNEEIKKQTSKHIHPPDSIEIGFNWNDETLINLFNQCKKFYSYDTETYLSVLAALCGCDSIIVPTEEFTKDDIKQKIPVCAYGVRYGDDDILMEGELVMLRKRLNELDSEPYKVLPILIQKINEHFSKQNFSN